jgi:hypothetical protein
VFGSESGPGNFEGFFPLSLLLVGLFPECGKDMGLVLDLNELKSTVVFQAILICGLLFSDTCTVAAASIDRFSVLLVTILSGFSGYGDKRKRTVT